MAYTLTQLRKDIDGIVTAKIDDLKNGFKSELVGEIKIQMAESWDSISGVVETKITAANTSLQNSFDRFRRDAEEKIEYFPLVLAKMNEVSGRLEKLEFQREDYLQSITRLKTKANGWGPEIKELDKRVNDLEDKPGKNAIKSKNKSREIWMKIIIAIVGTGLGGAIVYFLTRLI